MVQQSSTYVPKVQFFPLKNFGFRLLRSTSVSIHKIPKNIHLPVTFLSLVLYSTIRPLTMGYTGDEPQKVIIFDWDDTICPSSFFDRQQMEKMDELPESVSASLYRITPRLFEVSKHRNRRCEETIGCSSLELSIDLTL
jgi:hypothetical protein